MIYLAIYYGYEGWCLKEYPTAEDALNAVKKGEMHGREWKILREIEVVIKTGEGEDK